MIPLDKLHNLALRYSQENKKFFAKLKKNKPKNIDEIVHELHEEVFKNVDCLECGNCCKTISPIITNKDIEKISKHLKMKMSDFAQKYVHIDEDNFYVFNETPCPFLMPDNYCMIYNSRPKACSEYPHTDRKKFYQLLDLTLKNTFVCPAVCEIVDEMKKEFKDAK